MILEVLHELADVNVRPRPGLGVVGGEFILLSSASDEVLDEGECSEVMVRALRIR